MAKYSYGEGNIDYLTEYSGDAPISVYVIHGKYGDMLVDTGFATTASKIEKWISRRGFNITDIFITHAHPDHDWNAARFKKKYNARVWISRDDISLIRDFRSQIQLPISEDYAKRAKTINFWGGVFLFKSKKYIPDVVFEGDDENLPSKYGYDFKIVSLPGHTWGSSGILCQSVLYCGDAYAVMDFGPTLPPHGVDIGKIYESYSKMKTINPSLLACGHGEPIEFSKMKLLENR